MKLLIMYSSRTGNTRRLAEGIATYLPEFEVSLLPVEEADALPEADAYLVGYWADRGHADEKSQALIGRLAGKKVGLFGTLGAYPYGKHARHILEAVEERLPEDCILLGSFLCQGPVDPALLERFRRLPADDPHAQTPGSTGAPCCGSQAPQRSGRSVCRRPIPGAAGRERPGSIRNKTRRRGREASPGR